MCLRLWVGYCVFETVGCVLCFVFETVGCGLCIVFETVGWAGSQAELAPCLELAPPCLEQSDKLNTTPTNSSVLLLLYPPRFFQLFPTLEAALEPPRPAPQWVQGPAC